MVSFAYKRLAGKVPGSGTPSPFSVKSLDAEDRALLERVEARFQTARDLFVACKFRAAPSVPSGQAWWSSARRRPTSAGNAALRALTCGRSVAGGIWAPSELSARQASRPPARRFRKLDESLIEEDCARMH